MPELRKRETAYKILIGDIQKGTPVIEESKNSENEFSKEKFRFLELGEKHIVRVNIIANIIEKFASEGEKRFASATIDDASGQIRIKAFGDDVKKIEAINQGDTIIVIGLLRSYNQEIYILPEIIKKADTRYLLIRKLEVEKSTNRPINQTPQQAKQATDLADEIIAIVKAGEEQGGVDTEQIILRLKTADPEAINSKLIKMLEDGIIYEPRPGKVRYLG